MQNVHFTPPQLSMLFNVNVSTIKRWVDKGILKSTKTPGGHRRISKEHLAEFIANYPKLKNKSYILNKLDARTDSPGAWKKYYSNLSSNNLGATENSIDQMFLSQKPLDSIIDTILAPTLTHIGTEWAQGNISVYDEHRMSFMIRRQLIKIDQLIPEPKGKTRAVLSCAPEDHHEIPLLMLSLVLKKNNIHSDILGVNIPLRELTKAIRYTKASFVCITKTFTQKKNIKFYLKNLAKQAPKKTKILIGGQGWQHGALTNLPKSIKYIASMQELNKYLAKKNN